MNLAMEWVDQACGGFFAKEQAGTLKPTDVYLFRVAQMLDLSRPRNYPDMGIGVVTGCVVRVGFWGVWA
ncbi:hypothetical protein EEB14_62100 [Rhodococcus sp. WS4]|nr:hypothetical protein EEB14_62100 [Rhodococcus sp. WS4]